MRKLHILKAIVDFTWIFAIPLVMVIIAFIPAIFFYDFGDLNITINSINFNSVDSSMPLKLLLALNALNYLLIIYALYLFRRVLYFFLLVKVFDNKVIQLFNKIGYLLTISGVVTLVLSFLSKLYFEQKMSLEFGLNPYIVIVCLGLFFMVLGEIFIVAKTAKQENDLTI
ncbi:hypothetical protein LPB136_12040 [Tenacibaculum todarodis]|uniref:DUF2975 domain-containing protein n=1 Tax=Tenacibaculum todarodis TaxID=1850252 RepID=A0A1L3JLT7_9FLAO|nr:DUF2975 domain-containing protein [Tenacibaculum todarodis]APG66053.1 hypothetical protein LPB136_12040 [Tenacibaculum todarodis]